jgi:PAS domain S-box-containing protein
VFTVLYVDDEPGLLEVGKLFLEQGGQFTVDTITSAPAALALMNTRVYDAIIADYQMPVMDGIEFLKRVRGSGNTIPFILFTGRGREEVVIQALNEGADFYLQKGGEPVAQFTELAHQVRQAVLQRRAEISIRDLERREADIINFLPDATFAIDRSGHIIAWNRAIEEMTGVPAAEMLGKGDYEYAIPFYGQRQPILIDMIYEPDEVIGKKYAHIVRTKDILIADTSLPRPKGKPLTLMGKASPLYNRQGEIIGAIESIRDITEMKKAEECLRESEGRFAAFMDHLPVTAFIKDEQSINLYVNRRMEEIFGEQEWIGKSVYEQFPKDAADIMVEDDRQTIREGYRKIIEYLVEKNGGKRIFETHKFRIDRRDKPPLIGGFAIDITEQKRVEDAIRESEEKYRSTIEAFPDAVSVVDREFKVILANTNLLEWMRTLGFSDDIIGRPILDAFPFLGPAVLDEYRTVFSTGTTMITEESSKIGNGEIITETRKIPLQEHGDVVAVVAIIRDVTERKRAEEALNESEMRFRKIFENSPLGMALSTPDFRFYSVNPAWVSMTGYAEEELLKMSFTDITHPEHLAGDVEHIRELAEGKIPVYSAEKRYIRKDKSILWGLIRVTAIRDQQGTVRYFAAQIEDITERRRAEDELRQSEERFRRLISRSFDAVVVHRDGRIVLANDAAARILGAASAADVVGRPLLTLVHPEFRSMVVERVRQMALSPEGTAPLIEEKFVRDDRTAVDVEVMATATQHGGAPAVMVVFRDITGRKQAENQLREAYERLTASEEELKSQYDALTESELTLRLSESRLLMAQEIGHIGSWEYSFESGKLCGSAEALRIYGFPSFSGGYPLEDVEARVEDRERVRQAFADFITGKREYDIEITVNPQDGSSRRVVHSIARLEKDGQGNPLRVVGVLQDITERKREGEILRRSEAHLKRAEQVGRSGSWEFRLSENAVIASEGARALYGLEGTQWTIPEVQEIPLPEYRPVLNIAIRDLIAGKSPYNIEFKIRRQSDGAVLDIHSLAEYDAVNNVVFGVIHDITWRRKAEEELIFKNLILSTQQETSLDGILIVDENGRILNYNQKFTEIWGIPESLITSRIDEPVLQFVVMQNADPVAFLSRVRYLYNHKEEKSFEELLLKDGRTLERFSAPILGEKGKYYGRVWYFRDITERKKAGEALREVNKKLNLLSKITRHDINNQLTLLQAYLKILEKKKPDTSSDPQFRKVSAAAQRISSMIQFTREYEEIGVNAPAWQDCHALVDTAVKDVPLGTILVKNDLPSGTEVFADPLIVKVFYDLMDNAVRYGRKITTIRFSVQESGDNYLILCEDDGDGIPADEKERIFERNFGRNTGLGLFLSREILGITGITINETGVPGKGVRFEILVPKSAERFTSAGQE